MERKYYGHSKDGVPEEEWQLLQHHLSNTANKALLLAQPFGYGNLAFLTGLLHDIGKYSKEFQKKLQGEIIKVDHSTAGAKEAEKLYGPLIGRMMSYCIAGHHAGLPDFGTKNQDGSLDCRLSKEIYNYSSYQLEIELPKSPQIKRLIPVIPDKPFFTISFLIRMIYSCLVDADFLDTEGYMTDNTVIRQTGDDISTLNRRLNHYLKRYEGQNGIINQKRKEILDRCIEAADEMPGLYSLTVPTGGGKTLSSLAFGLKHALKNGMNRIIYVIPYTSIIEQNASVFKKALSEENVLEHHSSYSFENISGNDENDINLKMKYASENWDVPIVATTNVQFFESLYSNKPSKCRKLHNISKSVIIIDEAQMLPVEYLRPCLYAIAELVTNYRCTVVLCTATQPVFENLLPSEIKIREIIDSTELLFEVFRRVSITNVGLISDEDLSVKILGCRQLLCIVNTRLHAKKLFEKIKESEGTYHLSTLMCPVHRRIALEQIRYRLLNSLPCKVVSTQLIEAGVDVDFPVVYRSMAGLDSIAQSAGRCNREGKLDRGEVYVFETTEEYGKVKGWLHTTQVSGETAMRKFEDPLSLEAIEFYFRNLYDMGKKGNFDSKEIIKCFVENEEALKFKFAKAAESFKLIESNTFAIVIPFDENAEKLVAEARYSQCSSGILRKLQQYTVSIYEKEYNALLGVGALESVNGLFMLLKDKPKWYDEKEGLIIPQGGEALFG